MDTVDERHSAYDHLVATNQGLVASVAQSYRHLGIPWDDLMQEGNIGLLRAMRKFDPTRGCQFSTYAVPWIHQSIRRALAMQSRIVRVPVHMHDAMIKVRRVSSELELRLGREPTDAEVATHSGLSAALVRRCRRYGGDPVSLDARVLHGGETSLMEVLPDPLTPDLGDEVVRRELANRMHAALMSLNERERRVVMLRFGMVDGRQHTLEAIGKTLGITRERVRQIEAQALQCLRERLDGWQNVEE